MEAAPSAANKPALIQGYIQRQLARATLTALRNTQRNDPELWKRIERRAAEIRERGEYREGGK